MAAPRPEGDPRADDEIAHGPGGEHLARPGERRNPRRDVDGDAADVVADQLDLAGVKAGADLDAERGHVVGDRRGRTRPRGSARRRSRGSRRPVVLTSRPPKRSRWPRTTFWCSSSRSRQRRSPISAARRVESTMSVKRTVASTRSGTGPGRTPVRNSSIASSGPALSPTQGTWSAPSNST